MSGTCIHGELVLRWLHGEAGAEEARQAQAHAAACPSCGRLRQFVPALAQAIRADRARAAGECPSPESLAAWLAGEGGSREAVEAHLVECAACRADVADAHGDAGAFAAAPPVSPCVLDRARVLVRETAHGPVSSARAGRPASDRLRPASPSARPRGWGWVVPFAAAAGLLGGIASRWLAGPSAPPPPAPNGEFRTASADALKTLQARLESAEAGAKVLDRRLAEQASRAEAAAGAQARAAAMVVDDLRKRLDALAATARASTVSPSAPPETVVPGMQESLTRFQEELLRLQGELAALSRANDRLRRELADTRVNATRPDAPARAVPEPPPVRTDVEGLFAMVRQGAAADHQQAIEALKREGLDTLGHVLAYYHKDAPKDRRAQAGDELNRRGPKAVDHDLVLAMAHAQLPVRREAGVHLVRNRAQQDFGFNAASPLDERQKGIQKAVRWWEKQYRADFPEKALIERGMVILVPGSGPVPVSPIPPPPGSQAPPGADPGGKLVPPQYGPPGQ